MGLLNDQDTEKALLGLLASISTTDVREAQALISKHNITSQLFSNPNYAEIYEAAAKLLKDGHPIDGLALQGAMGCVASESIFGEGRFLEFLEGDAANPASLPIYAQTLKDLSLRRQVAKELKTSLAKVLNREMDAGQALAEVSGNLARMTRTSRSFRPMGDVLTDLETDMARVQSGDEAGCIPTGISSLDKLIGGFQRSVLNILAADTGVGKSAFLATVIDQIASNGYKVGVFSLEDEAKWLPYRMLAKKSGVDQFDLRYRKKSEEKMRNIDSGMTRLRQYADRIFVDDRPGLRPDEVVITARDLIINYGCDVIVVDHLGELDLGGFTERYDLKIALALSQLRDVAKMHNVPVVLATQVTIRKEVEKGSVPELRDIRNSREVANKARVVIGLGRKPGADVMQVGVLKSTNSGGAGQVVSVEFLGFAAMIEG